MRKSKQEQSSRVKGDKLGVLAKGKLFGERGVNPFMHNVIKWPNLL